MNAFLHVGEGRLTLEDVRDVAARGRKVGLSEKVERRLQAGRAVVGRMLEQTHRSYYGINTGFGSLKDVRIPADQLEQLQTNLIRSHAAGVGRFLPRETVRAMMLLRAWTLSLGHSGVRVEPVRQLLDMLNHDIVPLVPSQGSVGASGDLAPLAHLALGMLGEGEVEYREHRMPAGQALKAAGITPLRPEAKEALALLNGTQMICAVGTLSLLKSENVLRHADVAAAMSLEALFGTPRAFDKRVHDLRPHPGQSLVAENMRNLLAESEIFESHRDCGRVQDAYSLRCVPQVHGAARDALAYVRRALECEINSVTDNPVLFPETDQAVSAGNFHGQPVAVAMDLMALALTSAASISERRTFRLLSPELSGLPAALVKDGGLQSGLMMAHVTAAALVSECKTLAHPASVDSIPTWADQEDHVSMGAFAARKAENVVDALERVTAVEMICAAQGLEFRKPLRPAKGVEAAVKILRGAVSAVVEDRPLSVDIETAAALISGGEILAGVERVSGPVR